MLQGIHKNAIHLCTTYSDAAGDGIQQCISTSALHTQVLQGIAHSNAYPPLHYTYKCCRGWHTKSYLHYTLRCCNLTRPARVQGTGKGLYLLRLLLLPVATAGSVEASAGLCSTVFSLEACLRACAFQKRLSISEQLVRFFSGSQVQCSCP